jgi:isocitrate dehydrogenase (NAD+)
MIMSGLLMLRHIGESDCADRAEKAMLEVFAEGEVRTRDLGGTAKTDEFATAIVDKLR